MGQAKWKSGKTPRAVEYEKFKDLYIFVTSGAYLKARALYENVEKDLQANGKTARGFYNWCSVVLMWAWARIEDERAREEAGSGLAQSVIHVPDGMLEAAERLRTLKGSI